MFEALGTLRDLKLGMVIDGPSKGDRYNNDLHILEVPDFTNITGPVCNPHMPVSMETFKVTVYHKCDYFIYGERYYVWSIHSPEYWRNK